MGGVKFYNIIIGNMEISSRRDRRRWRTSTSTTHKVESKDSHIRRSYLISRGESWYLWEMKRLTRLERERRLEKAKRRDSHCLQEDSRADPHHLRILKFNRRRRRRKLQERAKPRIEGMNIIQNKLIIICSEKLMHLFNQILNLILFCLSNIIIIMLFQYKFNFVQLLYILLTK